MTGSLVDGGGTAGPGRPGTAWSERVVCFGWAVATLLALVATGGQGRWLPWSDDFDELPYLTGDRPVTLRPSPSSIRPASVPRSPPASRSYAGHAFRSPAPALPSRSLPRHERP